MTVLLHVSDPHFGTEQTLVVEALLRLADRQRPDVLLLSGDITQRARPAQFAAARRFMDRLPIPVQLVLPGNHDVPLYNLAARLFRPYANHRRVFGDALEPEYESDRLLVLMVKTTRRYRHKHGEVSPGQIERVARRLEQASSSQLRIVVTHQPVTAERAQDAQNLLRGRTQAVARWAEAGADLILGGHVHLPFVQALHEKDSRIQRRVWAVLAGTAVSRRVRSDIPNSVNLLRCETHDPTRRCTVERWDYLAADDQFRLVTEHHLQLEAA